MSGSRKSLKKGTMFNPRASNEWSRDNSKFGQKMLEKMGWKIGQGIGLNNQGITENIKVRLKQDNKGLGYQIKEDQWLEVRSEFSNLLSQLSRGAEDENEAFSKDKKSLEAVSQSSKTRVHYHKFTHGKDIATYKKEDLIGILGKKVDNESFVSENGEFIRSENMEEYFKNKKKSKSNDSGLFSVNNNSEINDQSDDTKIKSVQEKEPNISKTKSHSIKRKKSKKLDNEYEIKKQCEKELVNEKLTNVCTNESDSSSTCCKKKRSLDIHCENNNSKVPDQNINVNVKEIQEKKFELNSHRRKKSIKKLRKEHEIEEMNGNPAELICKRTEERNITNTTEDSITSTDRSKNKDKNGTFYSIIESKNDISLEKIQTNSQVEFDQNDTNEEKLDEDKVNYLQFGNFRKEKRKRHGKLDEILTPVTSIENKNFDVVEKNTENDEIEIRRKKKNRAKEKSTLSDDFGSSTTFLSEVTDDSALILEVKSKNENTTDSCLSNKKNKIVETNFDSSIQKIKNKKTKIFSTIDNTSADFMKTVIDYNSCNNVEDFISNFEKNREELMNKYREKYKMKYLMSSSNKIEIYGDEFDGRKLDCKKPNFENMPAMKILDRKNMSKAEKIVAKVRLLQMIKDETVTHNFEGSNLTSILGYGNVY